MSAARLGRLHSLPTGVGTLPGPEDITRVELPNGVTVLTRSNFASPSVVMSGYLPAGSVFEPLDRLGLGHFTSLALMRGTQRRTFQQLFEALESAGASLGFGASVHNTSFGGRALAEDLPMLLSMLAEVLQEPAFPGVHIERLRGQILTGLGIRDQDTADRSEMAFEELVFPDHPYGRPTDGYPETIRRISREDILDFHRTCFGPRGFKIVIVGAVDASQVVEQVEAALGGWVNPLQRQEPAFPPLRPIEQAVRQHIPIPGKVQTDLIMGGQGPRRADPEYLAASLGNNILGQFGMMGRIGDVVREQAGLAYQASTSLNAWIDAGSWEVSAGVSPANLERAIALIEAEIRRFTAEVVTREELEDSKAHYIGRLPLSLESNSGVANALLNLERFHLGLDYYRKYPGLVNSVTVEDILQAARQWLDPARFAVVSAGPELQMALRTGIDIVEIGRLEEINPAIRVRFIQRVFTPLEQEITHGSYPSLAGRFAAKEAVSKALGTGIGKVSWQDIEIRRGPAGEPLLELHGRAREVAGWLGLTTWSVSISHGRTHAVAVAVALGPEEENGRRNENPIGQ